MIVRLRNDHHLADYSHWGKIRKGRVRAAVHVSCPLRPLALPCSLCPSPAPSNRKVKMQPKFKETISVSQECAIGLKIKRF